MKPLKDWDNLKNGFTFRQIYPSGWGSLSGRPHLGLDKIAGAGTKLYMPFNGKVEAHDGIQGGNCLWIFPNGKNIIIRYMHMLNRVNNGNFKEGEVIGQVGSTGASSGNHLHCDISQGSVQISNINNFIDPETFNWETKQGEQMSVIEELQKACAEKDQTIIARDKTIAELQSACLTKDSVVEDLTQKNALIGKDYKNAITDNVKLKKKLDILTNKPNNDLGANWSLLAWIKSTIKKINERK